MRKDENTKSKTKSTQKRMEREKAKQGQIVTFNEYPRKRTEDREHEQKGTSQKLAEASKEKNKIK